VFAPYFSTDQGAARFAAIHKVFGASNASKLLSHLPVADRCEAVVTITYEAQARLRDPVYGCVAQIFALQQQVAFSLPFVCLSLSLSSSSMHHISCHRLFLICSITSYWHHLFFSCLQVAILQAQLMQAKAQLACGGSAHSPVSHRHRPSSDNSVGSLLRQDNSALSPELMASFRDDVAMQQRCAKADAGDLQYLVQAMMRSRN
jgi:LOB domain-containing protein 16